MLEDILKDAQTRMEKSIDATRNNLAKIRTGRAHTSLLDTVTVPYYGVETPLSQVASVNVQDARTLSVTPWEKDIVPVIEKAIRDSDLGLNPSSAGQVIRVPLPPLTEERRKDLLKIVRQEAESGRISVRNIRRDVLGDFKELLKSKDISEDDHKRAEDKTQKITDDAVQKIDAVLAEKETDLMAI